MLSSRISPQSIKSDGSVLGFSKNIEQNPPNELVLKESKQRYIRELLFELFDFQGILRRLNYCTRVYNENASQLTGTLLTDMETLKASYLEEVIAVSDKFIPHIQHLLTNPVELELNTGLHERVSKAAIYFTEKIEAFLNNIKNSTFSTDNKAVRKSLMDSVEKLIADTFLKRASLKACHTGFVVKHYLSERAKAGIEELPKKAVEKKQKVESQNEAPTNQALFDKLRAWRNTMAAEQNVPAYVIMHQSHLLAISDFLPTSIEELALIKGVGKLRAQKFGEDIIAIIAEHCNENNVVPSFNPSSQKGAIKKPKEDTKLKSFEMFKSGKSVNKIAMERGLTAQTIEGHLATFVMTGELEITELIPADRYSFISEKLSSKIFTTLSEAKNELGETVSWDELRLVANYMKQQAN